MWELPEVGHMPVGDVVQLVELVDSQLREHSEYPPGVSRFWEEVELSKLEVGQTEQRTQYMLREQGQ